MEFDFDMFKEEFSEEWELFEGDEEEFIDYIIDQNGFSLLEEMDFLSESETYKGYVEVEKLE